MGMEFYSLSMKKRLLCYGNHTSRGWKTTEFSHMYFDLSELLQPQDSLEELDVPFQKEEIDDIVKNLSMGKSPGPYGFNTDFVRKCWNTISHDFYDLCEGFYNNDICIQSINGSYVTLIPKMDNPRKVSDFRPISLLNSSIKLTTKILANRLQVVILKIIDQNQYGFIKNRSIQDCLAWSYEYLHPCHKSRKNLLLLKLDFEKAFDKIENHVIIDVMKQRGFSNRWLS
jgi:hypothetical protein